MDDSNIPMEYKPLSPWAYIGYMLLFSIPIVGLVLMIIYSINSEGRNLNLRNFARAYLIYYVIIFVIALLLSVMIGSLAAGIYAGAVSSLG